MNMKERELNKEMLENVSGGFGIGALGATATYFKVMTAGLKCNKENKWGWKMNAKCSCGLHPFYD